MNLRARLSKFESIQSAKIIQSNFRAYLSKRDLKNNSQHKSEKQLRDTFHTGYQTHPFKGVRNLQTLVQDCIIDESMSENVKLGGLPDILRERIADRAIHRAVERHRYIGVIRSLASGTNDIPLKVLDAAQLVVQELQSPHLKEWRDFAHSIHQRTPQDRKVAFQQRLDSMAHYPRRQEFIDFITNFSTKGIPFRVRDAARLVVQELQSPHLKEWRDFAHSIHQRTPQDRKVAFQQKLDSMTHDPRRQEFIDFITNFNTKGIPFRVRDAARLAV